MKKLVDYLDLLYQLFDYINARYLLLVQKESTNSIVYVDVWVYTCTHNPLSLQVLFFWTLLSDINHVWWYPVFCHIDLSVVLLLNYKSKVANFMTIANCFLMVSPVNGLVFYCIQMVNVLSYSSTYLKTYYLHADCLQCVFLSDEYKNPGWRFQIETPFYYCIRIQETNVSFQFLVLPGHFTNLAPI